MSNEEKQILLVDLCCRLLYGIKCSIPCEPQIATIQTIDTIYLDGCVVVDYSNSIDSHFPLEDIKPYLRPMSSMTDEERVERIGLLWELEGHINEDVTYKYQDWLNKHHLDYRGLIEKGLALEASEGMYKINRNKL